MDNPTPVELVIEMDDRDMSKYGTIHKAGCRDARDPEPIGSATHRDQVGGLANALTSWDDDPDQPYQWHIAPCAGTRLAAGQE